MVRIHPDPPSRDGAVAQLGEHLLCKQGVVGSIPSSSTSWACGERGWGEGGWGEGGWEEIKAKRKGLVLVF